MPRQNKKLVEVDVSRFNDLVEEALRAFSQDVSYAVDMAHRASTTERKRSKSKIRTYVRQEEKRARHECDREDFVCETDQPCGFGTCRFASDDCRVIEVVGEGSTERPINSGQPSYSIESVVTYLYNKENQELKSSNFLEEESS